VVNASTSNTAYLSGTTSLFTEWTLGLPQDFSITAGIGTSNMKISLDDRLNAETSTKPSHFEKTYKNLVSPHFALNKVFSKEFSAYASFSKGFKAPTSSYFFITTPVVTTPATPATGRVNDELKPEIGEQFEIGSKGALLNNKLSYQLALFNTVFFDKMTAVAVQLNSTTTAYSYVVNGGKQKHKGIEALIKYTAYQSNNGFFAAITPFANFAYSDFKYGNNFKYQTGTTTSNITTVDYSGLPVAGVSKITFNWGFDITTKPGLYLNFIHNYKDGVPVTSDGVNKSGSYNLLNAKFGFQRSLSLHFDLDVFLGINNISGTQYPIMIFVNQLPDAYIPAPLKAVVFGGINLKYNFNK
jgi:iron complex outermembrane receptor protein